VTAPRRRSRPTVTTTMTLWEAFAAAMAAAPDREAIVAADGKLTAAELVARAQALSWRLSQAGAGPGQRVLLLLPNSARYAIALFAVTRTGAAAIPVDPGLSRRELAHVVAEAQACLAVAGTAELAGAVREAFAGIGGDQATVLYDSIGSQDPVPRDQPDQPGHVAATEPAIVFLTSGTTGSPKYVAHTHRSLLASFIALQRMHGEFFEGPPAQRIKRIATVTRRYGRRVIRAAGQQAWLTAIPFSAIGGHEVLTGALLGGHTLVTTPDFHPRRTMELLERERVNVFPATPGMVETMLRLRDFDEFDLSSLLVVGLGGAPASPELVRRAQSRFGCSVTVGYGATELGGGVLVTRIDDADQVKSETVGRPFPGTDIRIVDEGGRDVPAGSSGELLCQAASLMDGYASVPGAAALDGDGWYHTNDLAVRDEAGNVRILGRLDDLIIRGGSKIRPAEVEQVLDSATGVARSAVVGVATGRVGQQVWAFVLPEPAGPPVDRGALMAHCRANLAAHKVPDHIRICESLPMTSLGKIQRYLLARLAQEESAAAVSGDQRR
jgi:acyl-CoA synthetase (AMP-forming)/AMP-acid ligase II